MPTEKAYVGQKEKWSQERGPETEANNHKKGDALGQTCKCKRDKKPRTDKSFMCACHKSNREQDEQRRSKGDGVVAALGGMAGPARCPT